MQKAWVDRLYAAGIGVTLVARPFSTWLMSQGAFLCVMAWVADRLVNGPVLRGRGWRFYRVQAPLWAVLGLWGWHALGLLWTSDLAEGWNVLRIKAPLLAFPLILITGRWDRQRVLAWVPKVWAFALVAACIAVLGQGLLREGPLAPRDWSPFVSHIRLSLFIAFGTAWWWAKWLQRQARLALPLALTVLGGAVIWKTATLTGALLLPAVGVMLAATVGLDRIGVPRKWARRGAWGALGLAVGAVLWAAWALRPLRPDPASLPERSAAGTPYWHDLERTLREGDEFVWTRVAEREMRPVWNRRSALAFDGLDGRNQELKMTLIRYLTSLRLPKDSAGVEALSADQIAHVERGIPTAFELTHSGLRRRWDVLRFEVLNAWDGGNPSGHSVVQRLHFLRAARWIAQGAPVWGVGTGDLNREFARAYDALESPLQPAFRLRAHNQYVSFFLAGGPLAVLLWGAVLVLSGRGVPADYRVAAWLFLGVLALSCLTEDTLETQAGVTFAGLFLGLFGRRGGQDGRDRNVETAVGS